MRNTVRILFIFTLLAFWGTAAFAQTDSLRTEKNLPVADYNNPKRYVIDRITVSGVEHFDPDIIIASSGLAVGDTVYIPGDYLSSAVKRLWSQRYYSDVEILTETAGDRISLEIVLKERPRVYRWKIEGVSKGDSEELLKNLKLKRNTDLSDYVINSSSEAIKKFYREKGFLNVAVDVNIQNDTIPGMVNVAFQVAKNPKVKIGKISFIGNEYFSDAKLRGALKKTHQKSINIFQGAKFKEKDYEEDKINLIDFYNAKGFRNATILNDSIYPINDRRIGILIELDEGGKYYFRNISWMGNSVYTTGDLNAMLGIKQGDLYDKKTLYKRLGFGKENNPDGMSILNLYQNNGYLFAHLDPAEVIIGNDSIDLIIKIFEGKQATVNEVTFSGNMRVNDDVIRRELYIRPGELYNQALLMETMRMLSQMGHFFPENLQPGINPVSNDRVNISFALEEQASDKFEVSGGWGAGMFVGSIGVQFNNVSLRNFFKKGSWRPYPSGQSQSLSIRAQSNGSYYKAISLGFTEPWLGGRKPNSLSVNFYYSSETDAYYFYQSGDKHFRTLGASVGIGRRLSWPDRNFTLYNEVSYQSYNLKEWSNFIINNGSSNIIALKTVFSRNSVDSPIFSRRGSEFSLSLALTPPYSLFQKNLNDPELPNEVRFKWIEFHKWLLKGRWFYPLTNNNNLVLMARMEMGILGSYSKYKPSPFEGFNIGGDGMSGYNIYGVDVIRMRGYEDGALTPYAKTQYSDNADYARAYNKYSLELRYPVINKPTSVIYGMVFAEGGNGFVNWQKFNPFLIKRSAGVGVRIYLPIIGMIGVDWGYGFDNPANSNKISGGHIHFMIGQEF